MNERDCCIVVFRSDCSCDWFVYHSPRNWVTTPNKGLVWPFVRSRKLQERTQSLVKFTSGFRLESDGSIVWTRPASEREIVLAAWEESREFRSVDWTHQHTGKMSDKEGAGDATDTGEKRKRGRPRKPESETVRPLSLSLSLSLSHAHTHTHAQSWTPIDLSARLTGRRRRHRHVRFKVRSPF